jgi:hypothetical protein
VQFYICIFFLKEKAKQAKGMGNVKSKVQTAAFAVLPTLCENQNITLWYSGQQENRRW